MTDLELYELGQKLEWLESSRSTHLERKAFQREAIHVVSVLINALKHERQNNSAHRARIDRSVETIYEANQKINRLREIVFAACPNCTKAGATS